MEWSGIFSKRLKDTIPDMVISRNGSIIHPKLKEKMVQAPTLKVSSRRVAELPSLRYGAVGAKSTTSGPLRVTNQYNNNYDTIPRTSVRKPGTPSLSDRGDPLRPARRVRFTLPAAEGTGVEAGEELQSRSRVAASCRPRVRPEAAATTQNCFQRDRNQREPAYAYAPTRRESTSSLTNSNTNFHRETSLVATPLGFRREPLVSVSVEVPVSVSPGARARVHPTGRYIRGTLSPTSHPAAPAAPGPGALLLLRATRDGDDAATRTLLRRAVAAGQPPDDINAADHSGRTALSYIASNGTLELLDLILQLPGIDPNRPDNEGNTPLHFAAQAGQVECLNCLISRCRGIEIDARNNLGFTPLMKAALQGRNKCAKLLLFAGANPTLRDNGRGLRADQWARFCGRYVCADVIEKHARQRLLERSTSYGNWGGENEIGARVLLGKVVPVPQNAPQQSHGLKSKLRKVFRTSSGPEQNSNLSSMRLVTQLTSAALCASSPVLPTGPTVPPVVKSLIRPLTVPRLQITLVNNNADHPNANLSNGNSKANTQQQQTTEDKEKPAPIIKPSRVKKKK